MGGKSCPGRKGQRWDDSTEAPASPLDCFSLSLPERVCSNTQQGGKADMGLRLGRFSQTPLLRGTEEEAGEQSERGVCTCRRAQRALRRRAALCTHSAAHQGWG